MTTYETISVGFSAIAMVTALYSIMSAFAAKRSAFAAEKQAKHAEEQANAAKAQAETAERQLGLMKALQSFDSVARITKGRRIVCTIEEEIGALAAEARRASDGNRIAMARDKLKAMLVELEDAMHLFPPSMWRRVGNFIETIEGDLPKLTRHDTSEESVSSLQKAAKMMGNAMQIEIGRQWAIIEPVRDDE